MTLCSISRRIHQIESPIRIQSLVRAIYSVRYSMFSKRVMWSKRWSLNSCDVSIFLFCDMNLFKVVRYTIRFHNSVIPQFHTTIRFDYMILGCPPSTAANNNYKHIPQTLGKSYAKPKRSTRRVHNIKSTKMNVIATKCLVQIANYLAQKWMT